MPNVHEILLAVTGTSAEARAELARVARDIAEFDGTDADATLSIDSAKLQADLAAIRAELARLDDDDVDIEVRIRADLARSTLSTLEREVERFRADTSEGILPGGNDADFRAQQASLVAAVQSTMREVERIQADAQKRIAAAGREAVARQRGERAFASVAVQIDEQSVRHAMAAIDSIGEHLDDLRDHSEHMTLDLDVKSGAALIELELVRRKLIEVNEAARRRGGLTDGDAFAGLLRGAASAVRGAEQVASSIGNLSGEVADASTEVANFGKALSFDTISDFAGKTRDLQEAVSVAGLAIIGALIPALIALGSSFAAAIAGAGALATALAAALGPVVVLMVALFQRLTKILAAKKAQEQEAAQATNLQAQAANEAAAAERNREQALRSLRDARQGEADAEADLSRAREHAAEAITDAAAAEAAAQQRVQQTTVALSQAFVDAHREMEDAAERVRDAVLGVQDAQLGIEKANVATQRAELELRKFREEAKLAGKQFDNTFKKFEDIDFDPQLARGVLGEAGGQLDGEQKLRLEELIIAVKDAKLNEKSATDALGDAQRDLTRAREDDVKFQRQGVNASKTLTDAIRSQREAVAAAAKAQENYVELQRAGIKNSEQVISAERRLRDAQERRVDAQERLGDVGKELDTLPAKVLATQNAMAELSTSEQGFLATLTTMLDHVKSLLTPATDAIFGAVGDAFSAITPLLDELGGLFGGIAGVWADAIRQGARSLVAPAWREAMGEIFAGSQQLAGPVLGAIGSLLEILRDIAVATMPLLVEVVREAADWLGRLAGKTRDIDALRAGIAPLVDAFRVWIGLFGQVFNLILAFATSIGPIGNQIVGWLAEGARRLAEWVRSAEGQDRIREFFSDVLPMVRQIAGFLARLGPLFLELLEMAAPVLEQLFRAFNFILDIVTPLLDLLNQIPTPITDLAGAMLSLPLDAVSTGVRFLRDAFQSVIDVVRSLQSVVTGLFGMLASAVKPVANAIVGIVNGVASAINFVIRAINAIPNINTPLGDIGIPDIPEIPAIPQLGDGGVINHRILAELGERGKEAVLPLNRQTMADLASAIVMASPVLQGKVGVALPAAGSSSGVTIAHQEVHLPPAPAAEVPDARFQAAQFAAEMRRRGS